MTTRKYNAVARLCALSAYPQTFSALMDAAADHFGADLDRMTAAQIAMILEFGYSQHTHGTLNAE